MGIVEHIERETRDRGGWIKVICCEWSAPSSSYRLPVPWRASAPTTAWKRWPLTASSNTGGKVISCAHQEKVSRLVYKNCMPNDSSSSILSWSIGNHVSKEKGESRINYLLSSRCFLIYVEIALSTCVCICVYSKKHFLSKEIRVILTWSLC